MINKVFARKNRQYVILGFLIILITVGNYFLSGGSKSNWVTVSDFGFTLLHPPGVNVWSAGLDENNIFDIYGAHRASSESGMMGFNLENKEIAVEWTTFHETPTFEEILDIHYHSCEVNAIKRDRGVEITYEPMTFGELNGHDVAYQGHLIELDMPDMDEPLFAKGMVAGWTCEETGISYTVYLLKWNSRFPPLTSYSSIHGSLDKYLETLDCH